MCHILYNVSRDNLNIEIDSMIDEKKPFNKKQLYKINFYLQAIQVNEVLREIIPRNDILKLFIINNDIDSN